jgi:hypothetical protein
LVRSPFVALLAIFGFFALVVIAFSALFVALADSDTSPGDGCTDPDTGEVREVTISPEQAASFNDALQSAQDKVDSGSASATVTFDESQVSSRASQFLENADAPVRDVKVCFHEGYAEGRATFEVPALGELPAVGDDLFDVYVVAQGSVSFAGERPSLDVTDVDVGNFPDFIADEIADELESEINDSLDDLQLDYEYAVTYEEGSATLTLRSR